MNVGLESVIPVLSKPCVDSCVVPPTLALFISACGKYVGFFPLCDASEFLDNKLASHPNTVSVPLSLLDELYQQVMPIPYGAKGACVHMEMDTMIECVFTSVLVAGKWASLLKWKSYLSNTVT